MKLKSKACSTGHGTGVTPPIELGEILRRDKARLLAKKSARMMRMFRKAVRHGRPQVSGGDLANG